MLINILCVKLGHSGKSPGGQSDCEENKTETDLKVKDNF